jgi:hypothetical protein
MKNLEKDRPPQLRDFVEPQRTGPSNQEQHRRRERKARLLELAADPATTPQRVHELRRLAAKSSKRRTPKLRRSNARSLQKLHDEVVSHIVRGVQEGVLSESANRITREAVARRLAVPEHQVEQVFARLVRRGLLRREPNNGAHDTTRNWFFGGAGTGWAPTYWCLRNFARWRETPPLGMQS